jgi:hypothetical protein
MTMARPHSTAETAGGVVHAVEGAFEEACELGGLDPHGDSALRLVAARSQRLCAALGGG